MIKNRNFMLGLGIGLIVGALLLQIMMIGEGSYRALTTVKEVQQAAAELNLKVVDNKVELLTEDEWRAKYPEDALSNGDVEKGSTVDPVQPDSPATPVTPESPVEPKTDTDSSSIKKEEEIQIDTPKSPEVPEPVVVEYRIRSGATLAGVASGLKKAGVISDETAFIKKASAKGINRKLQVGTYKFTKEEDYSSIISKISSGK